MRVVADVQLRFDPIRRAAELWRRRWGPRSQPRAMASATSIMRVQQLLLADFDAVAAASPRVSLVLKADIRPGFTGELDGKVARIEGLLADD